MIRKLLAVAIAVCSCSAWAFKLMSEFEQGNVYVSQESGNDANDGKSWGSAKKTIQAGIDAAEAGWTVNVAAGDYGKDEDDFITRVYNTNYQVPTVAYINKKVLVKAVDGREKTFITGAWSTASGSNLGVGAGAKRCVFITTAGAAIEGFTIRKGSNVKNNATNTGVGDNGGAGDYVSGGSGVGASTGNTATDSSNKIQGWTANAAYVINCTIEDCRGYRGSAIARAVPINCLIRHNRSIGYGQAGYRIYCAYNCIWTENGSPTGSGSSADFVIAAASDHAELNGTFINNNCSTFVGPKDEYARAYNCAFLGNVEDQTGYDTWLYATNCVTTQTSCKRATNPGCVGGVVPCQTVSSIEEDYRPVAGLSLVGGGSKDVFTWAANWVPEEYIDKDYYGNPRPTGQFDAAIDVGAVQSTNGTGVVMESGGIMLGRGIKLTLNGESWTGSYCGYGWKGLIKHPYTQVRISYENGSAPIFGLYTIMYNASGTTDNRIQYPDMAGDNGMYFLPPIFSSTRGILIYVYSASSKKYVQTGLDDYSQADGTEAHPYETIQEGVNASSAQGVVIVGPGTYDKGSTVVPIDVANDNDDTNSTPNRVYINKALRIVSKEGAAKTIIKGAHDTSAEAYSGCGSNAVRCVLAIQNVLIAVQGFTLADGATDGDLAHRNRWRNAEKSSDNYQRGNFGGGGFRASNYGYSQERGYLLDCIITNCVGYWGGAMYGGQAQRCLFVGNTAVADDPGSKVAPFGVIYGAKLRGCIVRDNVVASGYALVEGTQARFTTLYKQSNNGSLYQSCVCDNSTPPVTTACADPANGDFRLRSDSSAMNKPVLRDESSLWIFNTSDYYGNPIVFNPSNYLYCMAGAVQEVAFVIDITPDAGSGSKATNTLLHPGETATIVATAEDREVKGFKIGDDIIYQTSRTYQFTAPEFDYWTYYSAGAYSVKPVYTSDLYVDAVYGNDSNSGWTKSSALKTLAYALTSKGIKSGDTVHCAEGVYNEGVMKRSHAFNGGKVTDIVNCARVVLTNGVTLVADGSREATIIEGYKEPGSPSYPSQPAWGLGPNAMRCVEMYPNTKIKGFTLRKGSTDWSTSATSSYINENCYGGCVFCADNTVIIENCTMTDGRARYSGGAYKGKLIGCRVVDCTGTSSLGGVGYGEYYSCYFDKCADQVIGYPKVVQNCTIGPNCYITWDNNNLMSHIITIDSSTVTIDNSLIMAVANGKSTTNYKSYNSVWIDQKGISCTGENNKFISAAEAATLLDDNLVPIYSEDSIVLDKGNSARVSAVNAHDINGIQRIYNGSVDIGAGEYDWRPIYQKALFARNGAGLSEASAATVATNENQQVLVTDGRVEVKWPTALSGNNNIVDFIVTGAGTMKVYLNGELDSEYTSADGAKRLRMAIPDTSSTIEIAYEKGAGDDASVGALLSASRTSGGMAVILRPTKTNN